MDGDHNDVPNNDVQKSSSSAVVSAERVDLPLFVFSYLIWSSSVI